MYTSLNQVLLLLHYTSFLRNCKREKIRYRNFSSGIFFHFQVIQFPDSIKLYREIPVLFHLKGGGIYHTQMNVPDGFPSVISCFPVTLLGLYGYDNHSCPLFD